VCSSRGALSSARGPTSSSPRRRRNYNRKSLFSFPPPSACTAGRMGSPLGHRRRGRRTGALISDKRNANARRIPADEITRRLYIDRSRDRSSIYLITVNESPPPPAIWEPLRKPRDEMRAGDAFYARRRGRFSIHAPRARAHARRIRDDRKLNLCSFRRAMRRAARIRPADIEKSLAPNR